MSPSFLKFTTFRPELTVALLLFPMRILFLSFILQTMNPWSAAGSFLSLLSCSKPARGLFPPRLPQASLYFPSSSWSKADCPLTSRVSFAKSPWLPLCRLLPCPHWGRKSINWSVTHPTCMAHHPSFPTCDRTHFCGLCLTWTTHISVADLCAALRPSC